MAANMEGETDEPYDPTIRNEEADLEGESDEQLPDEEAGEGDEDNDKD